LYKQLLDITSYAKVEIKNAHPVDATRNCAVIMNTNENVFEFLNGQGKMVSSRGARLCEEQLEAIRRRFSIVPFVEKFSKLHQLDQSIKERLYLDYFKDFLDMERIAPSLFNFFLAFGLYQQWLQNFEVVETLKAFMEKIVDEFEVTVFG